MTNEKYEISNWGSGHAFFLGVSALVRDRYSCAPNLKRDFYVTHDDEARVFLNMRVGRPDSFTGEMAVGDIWQRQVYPSMTETQIAHMMIGMSIDYSEHEAREAFMWKGRRVFGPHIDVAAQWAVSEKYEKRGTGQSDWATVEKLMESMPGLID